MQQRAAGRLGEAQLPRLGLQRRGTQRRCERICQTEPLGISSGHVRLLCFRIVDAAFLPACLDVTETRERRVLALSKDAVHHVLGHRPFSDTQLHRTHARVPKKLRLFCHRRLRDLAEIRLEGLEHGALGLFGIQLGRIPDAGLFECRDALIAGHESLWHQRVRPQGKQDHDGNQTQRQLARDASDAHALPPAENSREGFTR